jgi:Uma2 family endonuclease
MSPSTARIDRVEKLPIYAAAGVGHVWLIDPILQTLEAFALHEAQWLLLGVCEGANPVSLPPFDAVTFDLSGLWED